MMSGETAHFSGLTVCSFLYKKIYMYINNVLEIYISYYLLNYSRAGQIITIF